MRPTRGTAWAQLPLLFGLAPDGVYLDPQCYHWSGELLPHHFTLAPTEVEVVCFCGTFRRVTPPRR